MNPNTIISHRALSYRPRCSLPAKAQFPLLLSLLWVYAYSVPVTAELESQVKSAESNVEIMDADLWLIKGDFNPLYTPLKKISDKEVQLKHHCVAQVMGLMHDRIHAKACPYNLCQSQEDHGAWTQNNFDTCELDFGGKTWTDTPNVTHSHWAICPACSLSQIFLTRLQSHSSNQDWTWLLLFMNRLPQSVCCSLKVNSVALCPRSWI